MDLFKLAERFQKTAQKSDFSSLSNLLAHLRAAYHIHQTHHWQSFGEAYYADHLLFQRIYEESQEFIDSVAERIVGSDYTDGVNAVAQIDKMSEVIHDVFSKVQGASPDDLAKRSLYIEQVILKQTELAINEMSSFDVLSPGISNLLEGIYDKHETFIYLLKRRNLK